MDAARDGMFSLARRRDHPARYRDGDLARFFTAMFVGLPSTIATLVTQSQSGRLGPAEFLWLVLGLIVLSAIVLLVDPGRRQTNQPAFQ